MLREPLEVFEAEGVDAAFVNTFASYDLPHHTDPHEDFDKASLGVVKVLDGAAVSAIPTCPGSPRPRSTCWRTATAADGRPSRGPRAVGVGRADSRYIRFVSATA